MDKWILNFQCSIQTLISCGGGGGGGEDKEKAKKERCGDDPFNPKLQLYKLSFSLVLPLMVSFWLFVVLCSSSVLRYLSKYFSLSHHSF
uniref:Transmembrane protein n=1 Tax=Salix viminalis TaxID=40686 RepID=A0A6N2N197_SALVM